MTVRGWCPGALAPMESGDGLVVRVRPRGGRLDAAQAGAIADAAEAHGNRVIELTGRANLQLRGVTTAGHPALLMDLRAAGLLDVDAAVERRRNVMVTPFADPEADALAEALEAALETSDLELPSKFGFAVDTGAGPVLSEDPADIRIERGPAGPILRADRMEAGTAYSGPQDALDLARWFLGQGGATNGRGRMRALILRGCVPCGTRLAPHPPAPPAAPGAHASGILAALEFGQIAPDTLRRLARLAPLRLTPWRMILASGAQALPDLPGLILDPADPRLALRACPGAPACASALAETRNLARSLAPLVPKGAVLHVSGCAKGCAWPRPADLTLTATAAGFDLIRHGRAADAPTLRGLHPDQLPKVL
ncbi:precorrin-3B synthase [Paracoccus tibetensis]|uniref:Precorrin-3B synthase n=1 Tax=Paracoccus tibetensis TaxID=336292 RepID=A0A1G5ESW3_9RHOB|nr:precorrin-3B synthase [Paracoccus tibetensis]SCY30072.1 precorrin-3B synthase [Paracoccus tibetensis]